jgi:proteasome accessory factor A
MRIFDRLIGLETEYAVRFHARRSRDRPTNYMLFQSLLAALRQRLPTAGAGNSGQGKPGLFLANGAAVWFERSRFAGQTGLIEGCTPECRSPRQAVICQRAQDRLLAEAAQEVAPGGQFTLLKNCRDSRGNTYGAQENYEAILAQGWRLSVWRAAWYGLYPLGILLFVLLVLLLSVILLANLFFALPLYRLVCLAEPPGSWRRQEWRIRLFGRHWVSGDENDAVWPDWLEGPIFLIMKLAIVPLYVLLSALLATTELRRTQRKLLPFLVSRAVIGGSGWLDDWGRFHLTEKAESRRFVWTEVVPDSSKPIFNLAHFCKMAFTFPPRWKELRSPRQRLQISLGDSNLCEEAEYLRVATTLLVLDAIEAGALQGTPRLLWPIRALRQISRDPKLCRTVALWGRRMTALEIQRWYLDACQRFVEQDESAQEEAWDVLRLWGDVLDRLEADRDSLVGRLDWVTKQFLLDKAGSGLPHAGRKKIDLRYHELSPEGYFARLQMTGNVASVATEDEIEQAMRFPPPSSPAVERARYIREFSGPNSYIKVGWRFIEVVIDGVRKTIDLHEPSIG